MLFTGQASYVKWLGGYKAKVLCRSWALLYYVFSFKFHRFQTVGFSYEDNCCQSQGIGKSIKEKFLKGIFRVD